MKIKEIEKMLCDFTNGKYLEQLLSFFEQPECHEFTTYLVSKILISFLATKRSAKVCYFPPSSPLLLSLSLYFSISPLLSSSSSSLSLTLLILLFTL
jgi:hypothetical protein